jgi:hypothetical protein
MIRSALAKMVRSLPVRLAAMLIVALMAGAAAAQAERQPTKEPPQIPFGLDAFTQWERWPYLRVGVRAYMRSTFDRKGGNEDADAAHFIRQIDDTHNISLDELGPGILWFVRTNHWHGSPWQYLVDGKETVVTETSTADPANPAPNSVFEPQALFPAGLTYTWSQTKGADLSWVPIMFEKDLRLAYGRTCYGTGYYIFWKMPPGFAHLSQPVAAWGDKSLIPKDVLELVGRAGTDIAPRTGDMAEEKGTFELKPNTQAVVWQSHAGPTMIRRIAFRVPDKISDAFATSRLRIFWDGRKEPSVDAPIHLFFGAGSMLRDPNQEYIVKSFPMTIKHENDSYLFATYFPMPFHKSARIEIVSGDAKGDGTLPVEWEVRHTPYTDAPNAVGLFHATYRDTPNPERGKDVELLDTRTVEGGGDWSGHIVGTTYTFTKSGNLRTLEGDPRFYLDDSLSPQGQGTGSEEWGGGGDYWGGRRMTLPFAGHPVGRPEKEMKTDLDKLHSAYRFLLSDLIPFGKNARFTLEHGGSNDSTEHYETVTYWYGLQQPAIRLTDELDIGNEASETAHQYKSPDGSAPEKVESRHEVGVDHTKLPDGTQKEIVPTLTDDGRRTKTKSEFVLKVDPQATGVMLRRRLDMQYPNQKAVIYVADGATETPKWEKAGTWYTAGGNTVVYAEPRALVKGKTTREMETAPPAHIVQTSNRRWRDDEFLLPPALTKGREKIRVRCEFEPVGLPLFPGHPQQEEAWTEFRYWAYCFVMPGVE